MYTFAVCPIHTLIHGVLKFFGFFFSLDDYWGFRHISHASLHCHKSVWHSEQHFCYQDNSSEAAINKPVVTNLPSLKDFPAAGAISLAIRTLNLIAASLTVFIDTKTLCFPLKCFFTFDVFYFSITNNHFWQIGIFRFKLSEYIILRTYTKQKICVL